MAVSGNWNIVIASPIGEQKAVLELTESGGSVAGVAHGDEDVVLDAITADGDHLTWVQDVTKPFPMSVTFDLVFDGDAVSGTASPAGFPASPVTGSRA